MSQRFRVPQADKGVFPSAHHPTQEESKVLGRLEKARAEFYNCVLEYKKLLEMTKKTTAGADRDQEVQQQMFVKLNASAGSLESQNVGEAIMALSILGLNSSFILRDRINDLAHKQVRIYKKICEVEERFNRIKTYTEEPGAEDTSEDVKGQDNVVPDA